MRIKGRRGYGYQEAHAVLTDWLKTRRMRQVDFARFLAQNGLYISKQTCSKLVNGEITPGPYFKAAFKQVTGIALEDGFIESGSDTHDQEAKGTSVGPLGIE